MVLDDGYLSHGVHMGGLPVETESDEHQFWGNIQKQIKRTKHIRASVAHTTFVDCSEDTLGSATGPVNDIGGFPGSPLWAHSIILPGERRKVLGDKRKGGMNDWPYNEN